jgi:Flp pilus assembly protein TadD
MAKAGTERPAPPTASSPASQAAITRAAQAMAAGRPAEAMAVLRQAIAADARNHLLHLELGKSLLACGRPQEALPMLDQAVALQPASAPARLQQGLALEQLGWHAQAADAYRQAIALMPRLAEAHARLGIVLRVQDLRKEAAQAFRRAAELGPATSLGRLSAAYALMAEGADEQAQQALRRVIAVEPNNAPAHVELGKLLAEAGDATQARAAFGKAVRLNPRAAGHYYDLARIRRLSEADRPLLDQMLAALQRTDLRELHRVQLELAVGKAWDDFDDPQQAMQHYVAGNQLKGRIRPLDRDLVARRTQWQIDTFTPAFFADRVGSGSPDRTPLLVLGMPRSGTTLVESVLACHSQVGAGQELPFWNQQGRAIMAEVSVPGDAALRELAENYLGVLRSLSGAAHVTDKKPDNFVWAGLIHLAFPGARIVHCRRHPVDTCVSILANFFAPRPDFSTEPGDLVFYYLEYERLMAHWRATLPSDRFLEVDYEALVADPEPVIRRLIDFCGLDWEAACLHPERSARRVNTASLWQVRQPIFGGSVGRWHRYAPWLGELRALLSATDQQVLDGKAG